MDTQTLQTELLELLTLLHGLNPLHLSSLCQFLQHGKEDLKLDRLTELVRGASPALIDKLVAASVSAPNLPSLAQEEYPDTDEVNIAKLPKEVVSSFGLLLQLYQLYQLLNKLSILQLMKIFEFVPPAPQVQQLQLMQQLQQLLGQLLPDTLLSLHHELEGTQPGNEQQVLAQLLQLRKEHFHLYQPLRMLLQLDSEELLALQDILPKLQPTQMLQLLALLQLQPFDVLELKRVLQVRTTDETEELGLQMPKTPIIQPVEMVSEQPSSSTPKRPLVRIVEQPPEKSVYKRNLKPNPTVQLVEDDNNMEPNLYIAPVLIRCDTLEEKPKLMTGNKPVKVAPGRVVTFRRLKITSTSHQQGESLFAIKFELRRYHGNEYEILDFVQSNPICVLSHSTQLKPASSTTATVTEVIPYSGSTMGGTRVAVLGNNFVDSPSSRVRFDDIDVIPVFHGPRTLICTTPQHQPGIVSVRVSNDSKLWSPTSASFTYEDRALAPSQTHAIPAPSQFDLGLDIASSICEAAWQGGYEMVRDVSDKALSDDLNLADSRGYTPLHYAAALDRLPVAAYLLERGACPDVLDNGGNAPLHWAVIGCHVPLVQLLLKSGANANLVNENGECALHLAASLGCLAAANLLLHRGAMPSLKSFDGDTPLHRAAALGHTSIAAALLEYGAPIDSRDRFGETPLHYAVREECQATIEFLLAHGADPLALSDGKEDLFTLAAMTGSYDILQLLLKASVGKTGTLHEAGAGLLCDGKTKEQAAGSGGVICSPPFRSDTMGGCITALTSRYVTACLGLRMGPTISEAELVTGVSV